MAEKVLIIAEAGVNHNGDLEMAKQLIDTAKSCGADIVKFQTARLNSLVSKSAPMANYQKRNTGQEESQLKMLEKLLLPYEAFTELAEYCKMVGIEFLSTPFDLESIHFLRDMVSFWKIPSGEVTDYPYLAEIGRTKLPVVLSTGMCELPEIERAIEVLRRNGTGKITLLHCNTQYPTPYEDVNLNAMNTLRHTFNVPVGYSDHTRGIEVPIAAVAMGAVVIEKHFTLDQNLPGPDHKASLNPKELKEMVQAIRNIEKTLGNGEKTVSRSEQENKIVARKSIVAATDIKKGDVFTENNLTTKRPGNGISPMKWNELLGKKASRDFCEDELIEI